MLRSYYTVPMLLTLRYAIAALIFFAAPYCRYAAGYRATCRCRALLPLTPCADGEERAARRAMLDARHMPACVYARCWRYYALPRAITLFIFQRSAATLVENGEILPTLAAISLAGALRCCYMNIRVYFTRLILLPLFHALSYTLRRRYCIVTAMMAPFSLLPAIR